MFTASFFPNSIQQRWRMPKLNITRNRVYIKLQNNTKKPANHITMNQSATFLNTYFFTVKKSLSELNLIMLDNP